LYGRWISDIAVLLMISDELTFLEGKKLTAFNSISLAALRVAGVLRHLFL